MTQNISRKVVVLGGSRGIGAALVRSFAKAGDQVGDGAVLVDFEAT